MDVYRRIAHGAKCLLRGESSIDVSAHTHGVKRLWANSPWGETSTRVAKRLWGQLSMGRKFLIPGVDLVNDVVHLNVVVFLRGEAVRRCAVITASDRNSSMVRDPLSHSRRILRTAQRKTSGRKLTSWRISSHR